MTIRILVARSCWVVLLLGLICGCSQDEAAPTRTPDSNFVTVTGVLTRIDDQVPVDGGVLLDVKRDDGVVERAYIPSFFTPNPVPPKQWALYEITRTLEVGNRIRVEGERTDDGIKMSKLARLE